MKVRPLVAALLVTLLPTGAVAESCDTNCHDQCRVDLGLTSFIEPTCHAKCEIAKKASCAIRAPIPTIPLTPLEQGKQAGQLVCGAAYYAVTQPVIGACSNWDGRLDGQQQIDNAKQVLVRAGLFNANEFNGVQIRMCPNFSGEGIAPERGRIYLQPRNIYGSIEDLAVLIGHEMTHIRQHRSRSSSEAFACDYSRAMAECAGCQDRRNGMEREAYDWEANNRARVRQILMPPPARICYINPMPAGQCLLGVPLPVGAPCYCPTPYGPLYGRAQ